MEIDEMDIGKSLFESLLSPVDTLDPWADLSLFIFLPFPHYKANYQGKYYDSLENDERESRSYRN